MIELELIDCNCNDCKHFVRDLGKFNYWRDWNKKLQEEDFRKRKAKAIEEAQAVIDAAVDENGLKSGKGMMREAEKMYFQFDKSGLLSYGACSKLCKEVSFIPQTCQIHTQQCFEHRRL